jgi:hypothetical protein
MTMGSSSGRIVTTQAKQPVAPSHNRRPKSSAIIGSLENSVQQFNDHYQVIQTITSGANALNL